LMALKERLVRRLSIQTDIVGANCLSALLFSDSKSAETTLAALSADPRVRAAGLYSADQRLFAAYVRDPDAPAILPSGSPGETGPDYRGGHDQLRLSRNILFEGKPIGSVVIVSDLSEITATITRDVLIFAGVLFFALL